MATEKTSVLARGNYLRCLIASAVPLEGDYEKALAPDGCFGVLADASGNRRAWMVHRVLPHDKATALIITVR